MENTLDIGNYCAWCQQDTSFGSGRFVNRIPVATDIENTPWNESIEPDHTYTGLIGYGCEACYNDEGDN